NLRDLLERAKSGTYHAPPVRRVRIPKGAGRQDPADRDSDVRGQGTAAGRGDAAGRRVRAGVPCLLVRLPAAPLGPSGAASAVGSGHADAGGGWVLELDIEDFFGSLDHQRLRGILRRRVRDGVVLRLIGKWLRAGVLEAGTLTYPETGTPQGGVISPLLANVY